MSNLIENLNWRHAVKAYQADKKVSQADIDKIVEAVRLAPTSSGLQPFKIIILENQELKNKLSENALNPECMKNCSHVMIFASWDRYTAERIDDMYDFITDERGLPRGRFSRYTEGLKAQVLSQSPEENFNHTARQAYIALGLALAQAAELKIDTTPIEGFDNQLLDQLLDLPSQGLKSVCLMYIGYADPEKDWLKNMKKVRRSKEDLVLEIK